MGGAFTPANKKCYKGNITLLSGAERERIYGCKYREDMVNILV